MRVAFPRIPEDHGTSSKYRTPGSEEGDDERALTQSGTVFGEPSFGCGQESRMESGRRLGFGRGSAANPASGKYRTTGPAKDVSDGWQWAMALWENEDYHSGVVLARERREAGRRVRHDACQATPAGPTGPSRLQPGQKGRMIGRDERARSSSSNHTPAHHQALLQPGSHSQSQLTDWPGEPPAPARLLPS